MGAIQDSFDERNPNLKAAPVAPDTAPAPPPVVAGPPKSSIQSSFDDKNPVPTTSDVDLENLNPWDKPADIPWRNYIYAKAHKMGAELGSAGSNVARAYTDDYTMGTSDIARAESTGEPLEKVRADTEAAKAQLGASRYGISAIAAMTPNPVGWLAKGSRIANAIEQPIVNVVGPLGKKVASGVGRFFEGGAYTAAQDAGHGQTENIVPDAIGGGLFTAGLGSAGDYIPAASKWARERWTGAPEAAPADITAAQTDPVKAQNAAKLQEWQSNNSYGKAPSQSEVSAHATSLYGTDMAKWPPSMRELYQAAGDGNRTLINRALTFAGSQATAGVVTGGSYFMGAPLDPLTTAAIHGVAGYVGDTLAPKINQMTGGPPTVGRAILNAYPALTGMSPTPSAPNASQDWTRLVTGLANPSTPSSTPQSFFPWS